MLRPRSAAALEIEHGLARIKRIGTDFLIDIRGHPYHPC
jgi:hypothetical protein